MATLEVERARITFPSGTNLTSLIQDKCQAQDCPFRANCVPKGTASGIIATMRPAINASNAERIQRDAKCLQP